MENRYCNTAYPHVDRSVVSEHSPGRFLADASELRWPPGFWPTQVDTNLGNQEKLFLAKFVGDKCAVYQQSAGSLELRVFND